MDQNFNDDPGL